MGYDVYDGFLPPEKTPYPFIYLSDSQQLDANTKNAVIGDVIQRINVWSNTPKQRGTVSKMLIDIKTVCRQIVHTENFAWTVRNIDQRIMADATTQTPLLHGVLDVEFRFS